MKKDITLSIELYKDGTVMMDTSSYSEQTYESGTVDFIGTIDGRRKTFDPLETMEKAGLVTTKHDDNMFPTYKATSKLYKVFTSNGWVLSYTDNERVNKRLNNLAEHLKMSLQQVITKLASHGIKNTSDVYQLMGSRLLEIIVLK